MLISVICIFYNSEQFCRKCLMSVLNQKDVSLELIAVDDKSTDSTRSIIDDIAQRDSRVRKIYHESNRGISAARNSGIEASAGDCFLFIDGDDWLSKDDSLSMLAAFWSPDVDWVGGSYDFNDEHGNKIKKMILPTLHLKNRTEILENMDQIDWVYIHNRLFNKKYKKNHFIPGIIHEDRFYNLEIYPEVQHIVQISDVTYSYFARTTSFSSTSRFGEKYIRDGMLLLEKMCQAGDWWFTYAKSLSASFLKCVYLGQCSRDIRIDFLNLVRKNNLLPSYSDTQGCPHFYRFILGITNLRVPDYIVKMIAVNYIWVKRMLGKPI